MATDANHTGTTPIPAPPQSDRIDAAADLQPQDPHAALERAFIDEFLRKLGHTRLSVQRLPQNERMPLLRSAASYATLKLTEIESRARFVDEID